MKDTRFYKSNGIWVPSATSVLPRPYLAKWASNCAVEYIQVALEFVMAKYGTIDPDVLYEGGVFNLAVTAFERESKMAADYGTYIHTLCAYSLEHDVCVESPHELTHGFMGQLYAWCKKHKIKVIAMEKEILMPWYGGRLDLVCRMDGKVTIIDFKTGKGSYYDSWKWQLAGYRAGWDKPHINKVEQSVIVKFNKESGKVNHKCFDEYQATRTLQDQPRKPNGKLPTEKYTRTYEMDRLTFNSLVKNWWLANRGVEIC